jgi:SAM-dependent methyltransferase
MLIHTRCPIDGTDDADIEIFPATVDLSKISSDTFSARRMPDRVHYRMVRNTRTGCLRADPVLDPDTVMALYRASRVALPAVAEQAAATYRRYLERVLPVLPDRRGVLEVGCGHGAFLHHLRALDFERVAGVEVSADAVHQAHPEVRPLIRPSPLTRDLFPPAAFSLICGFQVLDHLTEPAEVLKICSELLAPNGVMFWICHDMGSPLARLLGERCPAIDVEHPVLYDRNSVRLLCSQNGLEVVEVFGVWNSYPLDYWFHLAPLPRLLKRPLLAFLKASRLGRWHLKANFGNMGVVVRKA